MRNNKEEFKTSYVFRDSINQSSKISSNSSMLVCTSFLNFRLLTLSVVH